MVGWKFFSMTERRASPQRASTIRSLVARRSREEARKQKISRALRSFQARAGIKTSIHPPGAAYGSVVAFARCHEFPPRHGDHDLAFPLIGVAWAACLIAARTRL